MNQLRQFWFFAITGTIGFIVDSTVLYAIADYLGWYGARGASFAIAASVTWAINRKLTFHEKCINQSLIREYFKYIASMLGGAAVNFSIYIFTIHSTQSTSAPLIGVAAGSLGGLFFNFAAAKHIVFKKKKAK
jgi:putative flippase GtrA